MHTIDKKIEQSFKTIESVKNIISENFFGQKQVVDEVLSCVLCSDHALIEGSWIRKNSPFSIIIKC